jgi:hypothetical protein
VPWPFRRQSTPAAPVVAEQLEPIRIFLKDSDLAGWVRPLAERTTDLLQRGVPLSFRPAGAQAGEWMEMATEEILMVVPPPYVSPRWLRAQRQLEQVAIRIGPYLVTGTAHLRRGQEQDLYLRATRPFLPLTDATFATAQDETPTRVETLIVNLNWVEEFKET